MRRLAPLFSSAFPALVALALFGALPVLLLLASSLLDDTGSLSLSNYVDVLQSRADWGAMGRSVGAASAAVLTVLVFGVPYAYAVTRWRLPGRRLLLLAGLLPLLIPRYIHAVAWLKLARSNDAVSAVLTEGRGFFGGWLLCGAVQGFSWLPLVLLFTAAALARVPRTHLDAARLDGAPWQVLRRVELPAALPGVLTGALLVFSLSLLSYDIAWVLGVDTYPGVVRLRLEWSPGMAAAAMSPLLVLVAAAGGMVWWIVRRHGGFDLGAAADPAALEPPTRRRLLLAAAAIVPVLLVAVALPVWSMADGLGEEPLQRLADAAGPVGDVLVPSLKVAVLVAAICLLLCWPVGRALADEGRRWRLAWPLVLLPLAASPGLLGLALSSLWNRPGLYDAADGLARWGVPLTVIVGQVARLAPAALLAAVVAARAIPREVEEAAQCDGASRWQAWWRITLPLSLPALAAAAMLLIVLSLGEAGVTFVVKPPGYDAFSIWFLQWVHTGAVEVLCAVSLMQIGVCLIPMAIGGIVLARSGNG